MAKKGEIIDRTGEEGINNFGSKMVISKYNGCHNIDIYFPEYDYVVTHKNYRDFKHGKISCPIENKNKRIKEEGYNNFGSKMVITDYKKWDDVDVYFPEYNWTFEHATYNNFKTGQVKCPYEKRTFGVGYIGEGEYKTKENGKVTKCYNTWNGMLRRCYDERSRNISPTYWDCEVSDEWHNFQNFAEWFYENIYFIEGVDIELDKDILYKGNRIYSKHNCIFVPKEINILFSKQSKISNLPVGVSPNGNKFRACCNDITLGTYNTPEEAFEVYKTYKESLNKLTIDSYENIIPDPYYSKLKKAIYNYKIEISD